MSKSKEKVMIVVFFNSQGVIVIDWVPVRETVNAEYYLKIQQMLQEYTHKKCPELCALKNWLLDFVFNLAIQKTLAISC